MEHPATLQILKRFHAIFLFALLLSGCAGGGLLNTQDAEPLISEVEEGRLGAAEHPKIVAAFGGKYDNPKLQAGLDRIVARLVRVSARPDIKYRTTILNSPAINAFALPGGYLYVTRGLVALANDADELAAVLAHEMGHVSARHAAKRQSQAIRAVFLGRVAGVLRDRKSAGQAMRQSEDVLARFSRQQEFEADEIGVETAVKAGFDPYGAASFLRVMDRESTLRQRMLYRAGRGVQEFTASHPATSERISRVNELSGRFGFKRGKRHRNKNSYLHLIDGMLYGDDPREGYVRGRQFVHPTLKFAFSVPPGFTLQNARTAVFAVGSDDSALRFDGVKLPGDEPLIEYMRARWSQGAKISDIRTLVMPNGGEGVIAKTSYDGWEYRLAAIRLDDKHVYRFLFAARKVTEEMERQFLEVIASMRHLSDEEASKAGPLKIEVVRVHHGDTVKSLAARMLGDQYQEERFRVLNGLGEKEKLYPGEWVKLVTD